MTNITELKSNDNTMKEYKLYKIEIVVEEDALEEALESLVLLGVAPPISYQVQ